VILSLILPTIDLPNNVGHQSLIAVSESCLYSTRSVRDIWQRTYWSQSASVAYIHCRLDYCSAVL